MKFPVIEMKIQKKEKSRSNSAFFLFLALCKAILVFLLVFMMELLLLGLLPVWKQSLGFGLLWLLPIWSAVLFLFWQQLKEKQHKKRRIQYIFLIVYAVGSFLILFTGIQQKGTTRMFRQLHIQSERKQQKNNPLYPNLEIIENEKIPVFYVAGESADEKLTSSDTLAQISSFIERLPEQLLDNTAGIYLMEDQSFLKETSDFSSTEIFGLSDTATLSVHIRLSPEEYGEFYTKLHDGKLVGLQDPAFYEETIVHELCHLLDYRYGSYGMLLSSEKEFLDIYDQKKDFFGNYATSSPAEFFAECGVYYYLYPELMKEQFPGGYAYFQTQFGSSERDI